MVDLLSMPLDGGGLITVRVYPEDHSPEPGKPAERGTQTRAGPVQAGRIDDRVHDVLTMASRSLREVLEPIAMMSRQVLDQLTPAQPGKVQVEFGIELTAEAGAVLTKAGAGCHLTVTLAWDRAEVPQVVDRGQ
jgi:Trypsin-co-occurring domain 1